MKNTINICRQVLGLAGLCLQLAVQIQGIGISISDKYVKNKF